MNNRWCIIAGPRSGSTWFENMIHAKLYTEDKNVGMLFECFHPLVASMMPIESVNNRLRISSTKKTEPITTEEKISFLDNTLNLILAADPAQPLTMRLFPQPWIFEDYQYYKIIETLKTANFNFVVLNRKIFDRAISRYYLDTTGKAHRYKYDKKDIIAQWGNVSDFEDIQQNTVDVNKFLELYRSCIREDDLVKQINQKFNFPVVEYETLISDCHRLDIPITEKVPMHRLYDTKYEDAIINFNELLQEIENDAKSNTNS
jgi:hypothetical protein